MSSFFSLYSVSSCKSSVVLVSQLAPFGISLFTKFPEHSAIDSELYSVSLCNIFCTWLKFGFDFGAFLTQDIQTPKELFVRFEFHHIFYFVKNNRQPIFLDLSYKKFVNCGLSDEELFARAKKIQANKDADWRMRSFMEYVPEMDTRGLM